MRPDQGKAWGSIFAENLRTPPPPTEGDFVQTVLKTCISSCSFDNVGNRTQPRLSMETGYEYGIESYNILNAECSTV